MTDFDKILQDAGIETRPVGMPDRQPRPRAEVKEREDGPGFFRTAIEQDWAHAAVGRIYEESGFDYDPAFRLEDVAKEDWEALTKGIPEEFHESLGNARSRPHLEHLSARLRESVEREDTLAQYGAWGVGGRFATALVDPSAWLLALGSGGGAFAPKAERMLNAARSARAAGNAAAARTSLQAAEAAIPKSTTGFVLKGGAIAGAENAALESVLMAGDGTKDEWDVAIAALAGFTIGGGVNKVLSGREQRALKEAATKEARLLELAERDARLADLRRTTLGKLKTTPEEARASIQQLDDEVTAFRSRYERPVVGAYSPEYRRALESGGKADAKNPDSSATGADQFVSGTWLGVVAQHAPDLFPKGVTLKQAKASIKNGRSSVPEVQALLDKRTDANLSGRMAAAFDGDNQQILEKAGAPVDRHTMYAMHHFGPGSGVKFAKASDDTPMEKILSEGQLKANPYLRGKTKGEARANWDKRAAEAGVELKDDVRIAEGAPPVRDAGRGFDLENLDEDAINTRLAEIEDEMGRPIEDVLAAAADAPKRSELARLGREVEDLERRLKKLDGEENRVEARMLAEDQVSLGLTEAAAKQRAKMRRKAAQEEARVARRNLEEPLNRARAEQKRLNEADIARAEARRIEKQGPRLQAERDRLTEALGLKARATAAAPTRQALAELDAIDSSRANMDEVTQNIATGRGPQTIDKETLSAAKAVGVVDDITELLNPPSAEMKPQGRMQFASATKLIGGTFSGVLRGHANEKIRSTLGRLVGNSVGNEDGSAVAVGASEIQARLSESYGAKFHSVATPAYREWADRKGYGLLDRQTRKVRDEFMQDVGRTIRGEIADPDPAVSKLAARVSELFKDFLREAQEAGVKGFENVEDNPNYLPRVFDFHELSKFEDKNSGFGTDGLRALVKGAIKAANDDMDDDLIDKIGDAYITKLRHMRVGSDAGALQGVRWDDVGFLRQFLTDAKLPSDEIEDVITRFAALNAQRNRQQEGSFRYAKRRTNLDETFSMELPRVVNGERVMEVVRISDLFENNVESLFQRYTRSVSGHIGLAKVGIKSRADFKRMLTEARNELSGDPKDLEEVEDYAETAYKYITGQPIENATTLSRISRTIRDWNFTTTMNQAGFAQIPDMASLLSKGYLRYTLGNLDYAIKAMRRTDGTLDEPMARELEEWLGVGTDYHNNAVFSAYDHSETDFDRGVSAIGHTARVLGRGTQAVSGMAFITSMTQRLAAKAIVLRLVDDVTKGGRFNARRRADLGLDEAMGKRIAEQLKKHSTLLDNDADGKSKVINWQGWDDVEARDAMLNAVFREARRLVQEEDLGDTAKWMHSWQGKVLAQFRRFGLVAYTKQTLHAIAHQDAETYTRLIMSMGLAAIAYKARMEMKLAQMEAGGADQEEIDKMREERLSHERLFAASWANSSYASMSPSVIDSLAFFATGGDVQPFNTRSSGLDGNLFTGNPTVRTLRGVSAGAQAVWGATFRDDRQLTESQARAMRALVPYQNLLGMDVAFSAITADLPEHQEDDDTESIDWVFN